MKTWLEETMRILGFLLIWCMISIYAQDQIDFKAKVFESEEIFSLNEHLGKKIIVLNFFATWCAPCAEEIPELNVLKKKYKDDLFLAINAAEDRKVIKKFLLKYPFDFLVLEDSDSSIAKIFKVTTLPTTIVISKDKKIIFKDTNPPKQL